MIFCGRIHWFWWRRLAQVIVVGKFPKHIGPILSSINIIIFKQNYFNNFQKYSSTTNCPSNNLIQMRKCWTIIQQWITIGQIWIGWEFPAGTEHSQPERSKPLLASIRREFLQQTGRWLPIWLHQNIHIIHRDPLYNAVQLSGTSRSSENGGQRSTNGE